MGFQRQGTAKTSASVLVAFASSTVVAANNPGRAEITIVNAGANDIALSFATTWGNPTTANQLGAPVAPTAPLPPIATGGTTAGILLKAAGGSWTSNAYTGPISGRAATADTAVTVLEI